MGSSTSGDVIASARARFDAGEHRSAWDSLLVRARREPEVFVYRDALSDLYRRAGHPDQAARWGAHDLAALDHREVRALTRSLRRFQTEEAVREYLVLADPPAEATAHLGSPLQQRLSRWESQADALETVAVILGGLFGGLTLIGGAALVLVVAFLGDPEVQSAAQVVVSLALLFLVGAGVLLALAYLLRARWVRSALLLLLVGFAVAVLSRADMTSPLPFG